MKNKGVAGEPSFCYILRFKKKKKDTGVKIHMVSYIFQHDPIQRLNENEYVTNV